MLCASASFEERRVSRDAKAALHGFIDRIDGDVIRAFASHGPVVEFPLSVEVNVDRERPAWFEEIELFLENQCVGAEVDVFPSSDQAFDYFGNLRVEQGFAAGNADHRGAAFFGGLKTLFGGQMLPENFGRILDFAAAGASQIAAEQGFQHEHQRVALFARCLLPENVGSHGPHL